MRAVHCRQLDEKEVLNLRRSLERVTVEKAPFLPCMCVQVNVDQEQSSRMVLHDQLARPMHRRMYGRVGHGVEAIEIASARVGAVVAASNAVGIEYRNDLEHKMAP